MRPQTIIRYFGWSTLSIEAPNGVIFFDPFVRAYCGAKWFEREDLGKPDVVCITHGHEEHFRDCPDFIRNHGAMAVGTKAVCNYLKWRNRVPGHQLIPIEFGKSLEVNEFRITAFPWQHRDINVFSKVFKGVLRGNFTLLGWAWSSLVNAPFYSAYTGFHVELPDGTTVLNYNEGFNTKMTDTEIEALGRRFRTDILLAGMQMHYMDDVARGAVALEPKIILLYPPHEKFHEMMGASMSPWEDFASAVRERLPDSQIVIAYPGTSIDAITGETLPPARSSVEPAAVPS